MKIFEALKEDHRKLRSLADSILETEGKSDERKLNFERLVVELKAHAMAEERYFYKPMMRYDNSQEKARHSISEHQEIDELIEKLQETDMSSPSWKSNFEKLHELVNHHLDEEEEEVFQVADKVFTEDEKKDFATEYNKMMEAEKPRFKS
ncbi:MAG: hemerythrin domain-containing protein [Bacteroidota bacterium]